MTEVPQNLYHYTSFGAFRRIMESEILRGTHYTEFNDWSEVEMGRRIVERSIAGDPGVDPTKAHDLIRSLSDEFGQGERDIFVISLSEDRDSLSQWRGYSPDGGVAIGFRGPGLDAHFREAGIGSHGGVGSAADWQLQQCRYCTPDERLELRGLSERIDGLMDGINEAPEGGDVRHGQGGLSASVFGEIERLCCSIKHDAYAGEKEWRCFCTLTDRRPLEVHLSEHNRRYVEVPFVAREVIQEVVLSPHGDRREGRSLAHYFRRAKDLSYEILESTIPFRK